MKYRSIDRLEQRHLGHRVTVRRRLVEGGSSDVLGILEHLDESAVTVRDKAGERHVIGRTEIVAARVVGPSPELTNPQNPAPG